MRGIYRYYYYTADDIGHLDKLHDLALQKKPYHISTLSIGRVEVLIIGFLSAVSTWDNILTDLDTLETETGLKDYHILNRINILLSDEEAIDILLKEAHNIVNVTEVISLQTQEADLFRLCWLWPAAYLCRYQDISTLDPLITKDIPQTEAALINLHLIANFYRDRKSAVQKEKEEIDQSLSHILHSHLVSEHGQLQQTEILEKQLRGLSTSYGIISGDHNMIMEAVSKTEKLINHFKRQVKSQTSFTLEPQLIQRILDPYELTIDEFRRLDAELRLTQQDYQIAIDVVRSRIEIMMSRENISTQEHIRELMEVNTSIQKQSLVFQFAAGLIEFIVLAYYSHSLWKSMAAAAYHLIPGWIQFIAVMIFSGSIVYCTHLTAEYLQGDIHRKSRLLFIALLVFLMLVFIIIISLWLANQTSGLTH